LYGSRSRIIHIKGEEFTIEPWTNFNESDGYDLIIHLAYLNQDKVDQIGADKFIEINQMLSSDALRVAQRRTDTTVLLASSGAAEAYIDKSNTQASMFLYAELKRQTEIQFLESIKLNTLVVMRIWNVSGESIPLDSNYALGSFIKQGLETESIVIQGNPKSTRTYIGAQDMFFVYLGSIVKGSKFILNSGGEKSTILNIASCVARELKLNENDITIANENLIPSHYNPNMMIFDEVCKKLSFFPDNLDQQVRLILSNY
jgi:nucleoside-diphosphate-sugar epimerase